MYSGEIERGTSSACQECPGPGPQSLTANRPSADHKYSHIAIYKIATHSKINKQLITKGRVRGKRPAKKLRAAFFPVSPHAARFWHDSSFVRLFIDEHSPQKI